MKPQSDNRSIEKLLEIMARLRDPAVGCPWDREQTFATIAPYTIEEAYEVADAIDRGALDDLAGELGDLLFQVVFHARMAEEAKAFDFGDVVERICTKMLRRHPHVFGDAKIASAAEQTKAWEEMKVAERAASAADGVLADVPIGLPGLTRAVKLGRRAAAVGFDWPDVAGVRDKVDEELAEADAALAAGDRTALAAEIGDVLFSIANLCRHLELDPESCIRQANERFSARFGGIERRIRAAGGAWEDYDLEALEALWQQAKSAL
jgi:MazG family protein